MVRNVVVPAGTTRLGFRMRDHVIVDVGIGVLSLGILAGLMTLVLYPDRVDYWTDRCHAPGLVRW